MHILVADDHPIICIALGEMLKAAFPGEDTHIEVVSDSDTLLSRLDDSYELLVLDLQMPGQLQSVRLLETTVARQPGLKVVVYTGQTHPSLALAAFDLGAKGYVLKSSGPNVAMEAIRTVCDGGTFQDPALDIDSARTHPWHQLTSGERQVLLALASNQNLQAIAIDSGRSYKTVTTHKYNALHKLGLRSNAEIGPYLAAHGLDYLLG
jgi:two-component system capsular synthesis response regulator RcsB